MKPRARFLVFASRTLIAIAAVCALLVPEKITGAPVKVAIPVVGLWRFDEGSGTNITDSSGFNNNGFLAGENGNVPAWVTGQTGFGTALRFTNNGIDHAYVSIPGASSLQVGLTATNSWSITVWAYEDSNGTGNFYANYGRFFVIDDGDAFQFESGNSIDGQLYTWSRQNTGWQIPWGVSSAVTPLLDQWVHWALVYDGAHLKIYRNGNQGSLGGAASQAVVAALGYAGYAGAILIGSELAQTGDRTWNGMLDDVAVFKGALSQSQVRTVMTGDFSTFVGGPAQVITQPQNQTVAPGATVGFSVVGQGQATLSYQWYFNTNTLLTGKTGTTLTLTNVQANQAGSYSVIVSNSLGTDISQPAILIVNTNRVVLVGLWRFNEGTGTNVTDSSGFNNNGILTGENGNVPAWVTSQAGFGSALRFTNNGVDHAYVAIPGSSSLQIGLTATNPWSLTAWAYEDSNGTNDFTEVYGRILVIDDGNAFQLESGAVGDAQMYTWSQQATNWQIGWVAGSPVAPLLDQWVHWAVVYDGTNLTMYRNGNQGPQGGAATNAVTAALGFANYTGSFLLGSELDQTGDRTWNGMLDDIAVFTTALSPTDVRTVMSGNFSSFITRPPLFFNLSQTNAVLSWTAMLPGFQLQSSPGLSPLQWTNVLTPPVQQGPFLTVTVPATAQAQFYRLAIH
jgi:hypothetical protein